MLRQSMWVLLVLITSFSSREILAQTTNDDRPKLTERNCMEQSRKLLDPDEQRSFFRECMTNVTPRQYRAAPQQRQVIPQPQMP
jgi:hypothetical protein